MFLGKVEPIGGASAVEGATAPKVTIFTRMPLPRKFLPTHSSFFVSRRVELVVEGL